ncbi:inner membrane protein [Vibrio crassostreae]|uniref:metal-dependent hydrolase n=1 Tax=Vibrio crassostreae TaxID=246167 RepID=UPI0010493198|nr:metal-dependent hydrolase [Vibrio crassostreae]TCT98883.1 LexA-binding, inner membrane-associated putative hydrolase [Vibrio crassostreae]CAK2324910.1 inner membrane protein [Vibrio crassostreae]CAK2826155.1 inner membrane protein [Vibrio crassostreae]CAK2910222.1 inner membrane protein [Vibrio crassostreae]CAK3580178.1 inner membrane protein [Vibrio crassostreae]
MKAINHQITTASAYYICMNTMQDTFYWMSFAGMGFAMLGALLPDIDTRHSRVGRIVPFLSIPIEGILGHRGALHSLLAAFGLWFLCATYEFPWAYSLTFGYIAHLVGDACTKSGVNFFWPISTRYRVPLTPASNGFFEAVTTLGLLCVAVYTGVQS